MPLDNPTLQLLLQVAAPGGLAGLAVKLMLNGSRERIKSIDEKIDKVAEVGQDTQKAVIRLHTRVDALELESAYEKGRQSVIQEGNIRKT
jgi:hypothetical protein